MKIFLYFIYFNFQHDYSREFNFLIGSYVMQSPVGWNYCVALRVLQGLRRTLGRILRGFTRAGESLRDTSATVCTTA